jgi:hypothetical protein
MITVVSGLPRSGTSLMMQILEASGFQILSDSVRTADDNNPNGYYEFERVKSLMNDNSWVKAAEGKVVKVIAQLLPYLPKDFEYRVIFMERNIDEILISQAKMLERLGSTKNIPLAILKKTFVLQVEKSINFMETASNFMFVKLNFHQLFIEPENELKKIKSILNIAFLLKDITRIINPKLYRARLD